MLIHMLLVHCCPILKHNVTFPCARSHPLLIATLLFKTELLRNEYLAFYGFADHLTCASSTGVAIEFMAWQVSYTGGNGINDREREEGYSEAVIESC